MSFSVVREAAREPPADAGRWRYLGYKGGSEPGVIAMSFLAQRQDGDWYALSASWNNPAARVDEVLNQLRHSEHERAILVGHSHFLRELFRRHLRPDFAAARPELAAALQAHKLSNCGVAALEIDFSAAPGDPLVSGAQLLFGTRLVP